MGVYINPPGVSKEVWLAINGFQMPKFIDPVEVFAAAKAKGHLPVVLVDNGIFTAAGVAYSVSELEAFMHPDGRTKTYWTAPIDKLEAVVTGLPSGKSLMEFAD